MYNEFLQKNLLLHRNWDLYNAAQPILKLDTVTDEEVRKYYYKSYRDFYLRPALILRHIFAIRTFSQLLIYTKAVFKIIIMLLRNIFPKSNLQQTNVVHFFKER
jgi:hypothetical protein